MVPHSVIITATNARIVGLPETKNPDLRMSGKRKGYRFLDQVISSEVNRL
jgi:hypothetical protein